jgi:hypothetical protein
MVERDGNFPNLGGHSMKRVITIGVASGTAILATRSFEGRGEV